MNPLDNSLSARPATSQDGRAGDNQPKGKEGREDTAFANKPLLFGLNFYTDSMLSICHLIYMQI